MNTQSPRRGTSSLVFLSIFAASLGTCGACGGAYNLKEDRYLIADPEVSLEVADAQQRITEIFTSNPHRRALAAGRILVSILLIVSAMMLIRREENAIWWARHAAAAGGAWIALHTWSSFNHRMVHDTEFAALAEVLSEPSSLAPINQIAFGAIQFAVYGYLFWRLGQPEIRDEIARKHD